jgi:2-dehydropantoate 2-reductase
VRELGAYQPGLLLDFLAGRPTELASLCGEPYRRAFNAGAEVGRLEAVYHLLRAAVTLPKSEPSSAP